jgi:hypothetical protein
MSHVQPLFRYSSREEAWDLDVAQLGIPNTPQRLLLSASMGKLDRWLAPDADHYNPSNRQHRYILGAFNELVLDACNGIHGATLVDNPKSSGVLTEAAFSWMAQRYGIIGMSQIGPSSPLVDFSEGFSFMGMTHYGRQIRFDFTASTGERLEYKQRRRGLPATILFAEHFAWFDFIRATSLLIRWDDIDPRSAPVRSLIRDQEYYNPLLENRWRIALAKLADNPDNIPAVRVQNSTLQALVDILRAQYH